VFTDSVNRRPWTRMSKMTPVSLGLLVCADMGNTVDRMNAGEQMLWLRSAKYYYYYYCRWHWRRKQMLDGNVRRESHDPVIATSGCKVAPISYYCSLRCMLAAIWIRHMLTVTARRCTVMHVPFSFFTTNSSYLLPGRQKMTQQWQVITEPTQL